MQTTTGKLSPAHLAYLVTLLVKGFDGGLEVLAGLVIWITGPMRLYRWVVRVTAPELFDGSHVAAVHAIRRGAEHRPPPARISWSSIFWSMAS